MEKLGVLVLRIGIAFAMFNASAVCAQWLQTNGPYGGIINCLAADGEQLLAGTTAGIFRSDNNGQTWSAAETQLSGTAIYSIGIKGQILFAGTSGGLYRSTDHGLTWTPTSQGMTSRRVSAIACSENAIFAANQDSVFTSTDEGTSWRSARVSTSNSQLNSLAVIDGFVFAGSETKGTYRSTDMGSSWQLFDSGNPNNVVCKALLTVGSVLYMGGGGGVYRSSNFGVSWDSVSFGLTDPIVYSLATDGVNIFAGTIRADYRGGVFTTQNQGQSWRDITNDLDGGFVYALAVSGSTLFAGTSFEGIFRASGHGGPWEPSNIGLTSTGGALVSIGQSLFAATSGRSPQRSTDDGASWIPTSTGLPRNVAVNSMLALDGDLFAGLFNPGTTGVGGEVFRSTNLGATWMKFGNTMSSVFAIVGLLPKDQFLFAYTLGEGVLRIPRAGGTWENVSSGLIGGVYSFARDGQKLFAGTTKGVFVSTNDGTSWTSTSTRFTKGIVSSLAVHNSSLFAGVRDSGLFVSTDAGLTWSSISQGIPIPSSYSFLIDGERMFVGTTSGVFSSNDNGVTWINTNSGLARTQIQSLVIHGTNVFASTVGRGVWKRGLSQFDLARVPILQDEIDAIASFPNPFTEATTIRFVGKGGLTRVSVQSLLGTEIAELFSGELHSGEHTFTWNPGNASSGAYQYVIRTQSDEQRVPIMLVR